jgi:hypothetical protein
MNQSPIFKYTPKMDQYDCGLYADHCLEFIVSTNEATLDIVGTGNEVKSKWV